MIFSFKNTKLTGISTVIPTQELSLLEDKNLYNGDRKKIQRVIDSSGFLYRRVTAQHIMTSDLCLQAAHDLLDKTNTAKDDIDALLFISYTPDYLMPATAYVLHKKLELSKECVVMDIPQACSGYVLGLYQASMLINAGCKKVLLLVGDSFSKFTDMFNNNTAPVFGDAGTASLIEFDANASPIHFNINSDGANYDALICKNGGFKTPPNKDLFYEDNGFRYEANMDGGRIFEFTMAEIAPNIEKLLEHTNVSKEEINYFVLHQANKFILENIARKLGVDESKVPVGTMTKYGNQCGASIPCAITDMLQNEVITNSNKMILSGFGVGLSWASVLMDIKKIYCSNMLEYEVQND